MHLLLFIYGTLHPERAPHVIRDAARRLRPVGAGTVRGRKLDLGEYPGLLVGEAAGEDTSDVPGEVFEVPDAETLAALDAYEDYRPNDPEASLFLRVETPVTMSDGALKTCWVYVYNGGA
jgi:gamma-glutamylcyclotransferase (GGCT)/AIG2-like uncharacterized protein YtfP